MLDNKILVKTLKRKIPETSIINLIKIVYRPYVCPFNQLLEIIPHNTSIYDIGCGSGMFLMLIAEFRHPEKIGGIEIDDGLIKNANELLSFYTIPSSISQYNGDGLPTEISQFKYVSMIDVLHHIPKKSQVDFLNDVYDKMAIGSRLILKDIDRANPLVTFNKIHDLLLAGEIGNELSGLSLKRHLTDLGFKISVYKTKTTLWYPHYWVEAIKL